MHSIKRMKEGTRVLPAALSSFSFGSRCAKRGGSGSKQATPAASSSSFLLGRWSSRGGDCQEATRTTALSFFLFGSRCAKRGGSGSKQATTPSLTSALFTRRGRYIRGDNQFSTSIVLFFRCWRVENALVRSLSLLWSTAITVAKINTTAQRGIEIAIDQPCKSFQGKKKQNLKRSRPWSEKIVGTSTQDVSHISLHISPSLQRLITSQDIPSHINIQRNIQGRHRMGQRSTRNKLHPRFRNLPHCRQSYIPRCLCLYFVPLF